jgi:hypothetical protein
MTNGETSKPEYESFDNTVCLTSGIGFEHVFADYADDVRRHQVAPMIIYRSQKVINRLNEIRESVRQIGRDAESEGITLMALNGLYTLLEAEPELSDESPTLTKVAETLDHELTELSPIDNIVYANGLKLSKHEIRADYGISHTCLASGILSVEYVDLAKPRAIFTSYSEKNDGTGNWEGCGFVAELDTYEQAVVIHTVEGEPYTIREKMPISQMLKYLRRTS